MTTNDLNSEAIAPIPDDRPLHCTLAFGTWESTTDTVFEFEPQHGPQRPSILFTIAGSPGFFRDGPDGGYIHLPLQP